MTQRLIEKASRKIGIEPRHLQSDLVIITQLLSNQGQMLYMEFRDRMRGFNPHRVDNGRMAYDMIRTNRAANQSGRGDLRLIFDKNGELEGIAKHTSSGNYKIIVYN